MVSEHERKHRAMWHWLSEHPYAEKRDYFIQNNLIKDMEGLSSYYLCYACKECVKYCRACPISWPKTISIQFLTPPCSKQSSPYYKWDSLRNLFTLGKVGPYYFEYMRVIYANQIRDIPWRSRRSIILCK